MNLKYNCQKRKKQLFKKKNKYKNYRITYQTVKKVLRIKGIKSLNFKK